MKLKIYQVDAFTDKVFSGNPASVCPLNEWLEDGLMQKIALENNQAETAFYVKRGNQFELRWFTPTVEVDLCGHATLASAHVLFNHENYSTNEITFDSARSGVLKVKRQNNLLILDFPTDTIKAVEVADSLTSGFNIKPIEIYKGKTDYLFIYENENQIKSLEPDFEMISKMDCRGVMVTATGSDVDFASRFFAPQTGINEDPVTGSAHTTLTPYWSAKLGKKELTARQLSARGGYLQCKYLGSRTEIAGNAMTYMTGEIIVK